MLHVIDHPRLPGLHGFREKYPDFRGFRFDFFGLDTAFSTANGIDNSQTH